MQVTCSAALLSVEVFLQTFLYVLL
jgi:hypothetical protein